MRKRSELLNGLFDHAKTAVSRRAVLGGLLAAAASAGLPKKAAALTATQKLLLEGSGQSAPQNVFNGLINVAQGAFCNTGSTSQFSGRQRFKSCRTWFLGQSSEPYIKLVFFPWGLGNIAGHEEVYEASGPITVPLMTVTFNGITKTVLFGGQQSHTFSPVGFCEFSDAIFASDFGLPLFPPNAVLVIKHYYDLLNVSDQAPARARGFPFWQRVNYLITNEPANGLTTEFQGSGTFTFPTGAVAQSCFGPNLIVGAPTSDMNSYGIFGDSISADGVGDGVIVQNELTQGYLARSLYAAGEAFIIHGLGGRGIYHSMVNNTFTRMLMYAMNLPLIPQGGNDISNGHNAAKLLADMKQFSGWCRAAGAKKIVWGTVLPRTSSGVAGNALTNFRDTDLTNQAPYFTQNPGGVGFHQGEDKDIYNADILANKGTGNGYPDDVIDCGAVCAETTDTGKYKIPPVPFSSTLAAAATAGASQLSFTAAPVVGDAMIFNVGSSNVEPVAADTGMYIVQTVGGVGPFTVTFATADAYEGGGLPFGRTLGNNLSLGAVIKNTWSGDETHPTYPLHKLIHLNASAPKIASFAIVPAMDPDAATLIASFTTAPNTARQNLINRTILQLKAWDIWTHIVAMSFLAAHEKAAAYRNWKTPGTLDVLDGVAPTFTVDSGITGDGTTQYCTINGLTSLANANSVHAAILNLAGGGVAGFELGSLNGFLRMGGRSGTNSQIFLSGATALNQNPGGVTPAFNLGLRRLVSGVSDDTQRAYHDGIPDQTAVVPVTTAINQITLLRSTTQFTSRPLAFYAIGDGQLSDTQIAAYSKIVRFYLGPNGLNIIP